MARLKLLTSTAYLIGSGVEREKSEALSLALVLHSRILLEPLASYHVLRRDKRLSINTDRMRYLVPRSL